MSEDRDRVTWPTSRAAPREQFLAGALRALEGRAFGIGRAFRAGVRVYLDLDATVVRGRFDGDPVFAHAPGEFLYRFLFFDFLLG